MPLNQPPTRPTIRMIMDNNCTTTKQPTQPGPSAQTGHDNIIMIGMPGSGKSTIGVVLAKILNYDFCDVDLVIQQRCDKTLQRLIDALGPQGFIEVENEVLCDLTFEHTIVATGGSAVYSHDAITHLAQMGRIVYLKVDLPELKQRLEDFSERGVVMRREGCSSLDELFEERRPLYEKYAQITVDINGLTITEAAQKVQRALETAPKEA